MADDRKTPGIDQTFSVMNYGAMGDGKADDTTAIQSAIDAASARGGGGVWFPAGTSTQCRQ